MIIVVRHIVERTHCCQAARATSTLNNIHNNYFTNFHNLWRRNRLEYNKCILLAFNTRKSFFPLLFLVGDNINNINLNDNQ